MKKIIKIEGMSCNHCAGAVKKALEEITGVSAVAVDLENKAATLEISAAVTDEALRSAVEEAGYKAIKIN
ncbi:MAG: copper ion binding protein [Oscillospiraceae bacterium]|nr:copper ion binding protein [Oscillospiraceae bacterium]